MRTKLVTALPIAAAAAVLALSACATESLEDHQEPDAEEPGAPSDSNLMSWDEFREQTLAGPYSGSFIVEGDLVIRDEGELRRYYAHYRGARANVSFFGGVDNTHHVGRKLRLTYCISDGFGGDKAEIVEAMKIATMDWERATDVNFIHLSTYDDTCHPDTLPDDVYFAVRKSGGDYNGAGFFPHEQKADRIVFFTDKGLDQSAEQFRRTVRHELGHVLGLRHEHIRNPLERCTKETTSSGGLGSRDLSPYDGGSIMHYNWCPGSIGDPTKLSRYDVVAVKNLYSLPRDQWLGKGPAYRHETDYNGDGRKDILWLDVDDNWNTQVWTGTSGPKFTSAYVNTSSIPERPKPIVGLFNNDYRTDVFMYTQSTALDYLWLAKETGFGALPINVDGTFQPLLGDLTADQNTDMLWYRPGDHADYVWTWGDGTHVSTEVAVDGYYHPVVLDYSGDGLSDIVWYNPYNTGAPVWAGKSGATFTKFAIDVADVGLGDGEPYQAIVGRFDGDAHADILWYRPGGASDVLWFGGATTPADRVSSLEILGTYKPFTGDFDGNGINDIFWYAPGSDPDTLWLFYANGTHGSYSVDVDGDYSPIVGDVDGDGDSDILWYRAEGPTSPLWTATGRGRFESGGFWSTPVGAYPVGYGTTY